MARPERYQQINFVPPASVAADAEKGLRLRKQFQRGGTRVGLARARDLKNQRNLTPETVKRMCSYFSAHAQDPQLDGFGNDEDPAPEYIGWLLWGGDAGRQWGQRVLSQMVAADRADRENRSAA